jgi:hypothetical protein
VQLRRAWAMASILIEIMATSTGSRLIRQESSCAIGMLINRPASVTVVNRDLTLHYLVTVHYRPPAPARALFFKCAY